MSVLLALQPFFKYTRLPFSFINTDVARAAILCMLEEANKAEMVREN